MLLKLRHDVEQLVARGAQLRQRVLVHPGPLRFVVFSDLVSQLDLGQPLRCSLLLFLKLLDEPVNRRNQSKVI